MKKFITAIIAIVYLVSTSGVVVNLHYCMGKLQEKNFFVAKVDDKCGKCGMEKNTKTHKCCKDEVKVYKLEKDQKSFDYSYLKYISTVAILPTTFYQVFYTEAVQAKQLAVNPANAPPILGKQSIYKLNCTYLI